MRILTRAMIRQGDVSRTGYIPSQVMDYLRTAPRGRWVAVMECCYPSKDGVCGEGFATCGWDGSYHAANYIPTACAVGRTPARARRKLRRVLAQLATGPAGDRVADRFRLRAMVRPGD